jgi:hypothetical protein
MGRKDQKLSLHSFKFRIIAMHKKTDMWHVFSGCYFDDIRVLHIFPALLFGIHLLGLVTTYLSYHLSILDQQSELLYSTQFLAVTNFRLTILPQIWTSSRKSPENHPKITQTSPQNHPENHIIARSVTPPRVHPLSRRPRTPRWAHQASNANRWGFDDAKWGLYQSWEFHWTQLGFNQ